jgi:hypothetical protein
MKQIIEVQLEGLPPFELEHEGEVGVLVEAIKAKSGFAEEIFVFEHDGELLAEIDISERSVLQVVGHRCHEVHVEVGFEHHKEAREFKPSATINRVLQWAVASKKFNLDPQQRSKANLMLPGADKPLDKALVLGQLLQHPGCRLVLELTLKDFTNG